MRYPIRGYHFQRTPLVAFLVRETLIEFVVSPASMNQWASNIFEASSYNFNDTEEIE